MTSGFDTRLDTCMQPCEGILARTNATLDAMEKEFAAVVAQVEKELRNVRKAEAAYAASKKLVEEAAQEVREIVNERLNSELLADALRDRRLARQKCLAFDMKNAHLRGEKWSFEHSDEYKSETDAGCTPPRKKAMLARHMTKIRSELNDDTCKKQAQLELQKAEKRVEEVRAKIRQDEEAKSKKVSQTKTDVDVAGGQNRKKRSRENDSARGESTDPDPQPPHKNN